MNDKVDLNEENKSIHINSITIFGSQSSKNENLSYDSSNNRAKPGLMDSYGTVQSISILNSFIKSLLEIFPEDFKEYDLKNDFSDEVLRNKIIDDIKNMVKNLNNKIEELNKSLDLNKQIKKIIINQKKYNEILVNQNKELMSKLANSLDEIEKLKNEINSLNIFMKNNNKSISNLNSPRKNNKMNNNNKVTYKYTENYVIHQRESEKAQTIINSNIKTKKYSPLISNGSSPNKNIKNVSNNNTYENWVKKIDGKSKNKSKKKMNQKFNNHY